MPGRVSFIARCRSTWGVHADSGYTEETTTRGMSQRDANGTVSAVPSTDPTIRGAKVMCNET